MTCAYLDREQSLVTRTIPSHREHVEKESITFGPDDEELEDEEDESLAADDATAICSMTIPDCFWLCPHAPMVLADKARSVFRIISVGLSERLETGGRADGRADGWAEGRADVAIMFKSV